MKTIEPRKDRIPQKHTGFQENQKVALRITTQTEKGFTAVIDGTHKGILYKNEIFQPLQIGQQLTGYIKKVRDDNKIDLYLQKPGYQTVDPLIRKIMDQLKAHGGFLAATDKSRPSDIADLFGVSKKTFKKAIGNLYKKRLIVIEKDGIRLQEKKRTSPPKRRPGFRSRRANQKKRR